jgi:two-component system nitrogen regulation response regulator GlnG
LRDRRGDIPDLARHFLLVAARDGLASKNLTTVAIEELQRYDWPGNVRELENLMRRIAVLYSESNIDARMVTESLAAGTMHRENRDAAGRLTDETLGQSVDRHLRAYFAAHQGRLPANGLYDRILQEMERPLLTICLEATRGNQIKAAELLGLNRNTLRKKLRELDIRARRPGTAE